MTSTIAKSLAAITIAGVGTGIAITSMPETVRSSTAYWKLSTTMTKGLLKFTENDPEFAHKLTVKSLQYGFGPVDITSRKPLSSSTSKTGSDRMKIKVWDRDFRNPVGMPAGFDKQAEVFPELFDLGFSFVEIGGVTPLPQPGNPKPRVFRLAEDGAIINRYGLNSDGHDVVSKRLISRKKELRDDAWIGVNLAKNTESASNNPYDDYIKGVIVFGPHVDFIVLNVCCPNVSYTKSLTNNSDEMVNLVKNVKVAHDKLYSSESNAKEQSKSKKPALLLKISPDMDDAGKEFMAKLVIDQNIDGVVISNTTTARPAELQSARKEEKGGLSGKPLAERSLKTLKDIYVLTKGKVPIIAVGGISSGEDAYKR